MIIGSYLMAQSPRSKYLTHGIFYQIVDVTEKEHVVVYNDSGELKPYSIKNFDIGNKKEDSSQKWVHVSLDKGAYARVKDGCPDEVIKALNDMVNKVYDNVEIIEF